jgi:hypothetical protein
MKLLLCLLALAPPLLATPAEDAAAQEKALALLRAQKSAERAAAADKLEREGRTRETVLRQKASTAITGAFRIVQVTADGVLAAPVVSVKGLEMYREVQRTVMVQGKGLDSHKQVPQMIRDVVLAPEVSLPALIFICCDTAKLYDGLEISRTIWPAGVHRYTTVQNAPATVPGFTTIFDPSPSSAVATR